MDDRLALFKAVGIVFGVLIGGILIIALVGASYDAIFGRKLDPFRTNLSVYARAGGFPERLTARPTRRGRVIVLCQEPGGPVYIDAYVWDMLYPGVRASAPQEVGTVIITQWNRTLAGNYFGVSGNAYNWDCDIIVADWKDRVITHRAKVRGPRAPAEIYVSNAATHAPTEHLGNDGKMAVVGWVNSLHEAP